MWAPSPRCSICCERVTNYYITLSYQINISGYYNRLLHDIILCGLFRQKALSVAKERQIIIFDYYIRSFYQIIILDYYIFIGLFHKNALSIAKERQIITLFMD